jgi:hypothetical protein
MADDQRRTRKQRPTTDRQAFDGWLDRQLHTLFDDIAREPLPQSIMDLLESDRDVKPGTEPQPDTPARDDPTKRKC